MLRTIWGKKYTLCYMGASEKEAKVPGKYYPKDIDIAVIDNKTPVFCLGIKFITSNYKQNANNYFENMMGETANLQACHIPYAHIIIMRYQTPYYQKNNSKTPKKTEIISEKDITKYLKLMYDTPQAHQPKELCLFLVDINETTAAVCATNLNKAFGKPFAALITEQFSPDKFFKQIKNYKKCYELDKK